MDKSAEGLGLLTSSHADCQLLIFDQGVLRVWKPFDECHTDTSYSRMDRFARWKGGILAIKDQDHHSYLSDSHQEW